MDDYDLTVPQGFARGDYQGIFRQLRAEDPIHWTVGRLKKGFWSITKYDDVRAIFSDADNFCSQLGTFVPSPEVDTIPLAERGRNAMIVMTDPPRHQPLRRAMNSGFFPRAVLKLEAQARQVTSAIMDEIAARGECDFVLDVAAKMPLAIICQMMDLPRDEWDPVFRWANEIICGEDEEFQSGRSPDETFLDGARGLFDYSVKLSHERRRSPGNDIVSDLATATIFGDHATDAELGFNGIVFVTGGFETTRNALSAGMLEFIRNPVQRRRLVENPALMPSAIEEVLRFSSPVTHIMRTATRDLEYRGRRIREGDRLALWIASANYDEDVFADPFTFDIGRDPNYHVAFGYGRHFCLGAHLARLEMRIAFEQLLQRFPDMELAGEVQRLASMQFAGIKHMPVRFTPKRATAKSGSVSLRAG